MKVIDRAQRLRDRFDQLRVDAVILSASPDVQYVSGFSGEGWAIVDDGVAVITDGRYELRAEREAPGAEIIVRSGGAKEPARDHLAAKSVTRVGFQSDHVTVSARDELSETLNGVELVPIKKALRNERMAKDPDEIGVLRRAIAATDAAFERLAAGLEPGITEKEVALEVQRQVLLAGGDKLSFDTIAASGPNSADPHAEPTDRVLGAHDIVKLDFGAAIAGYHADLTRTLFLGEPDEKQREIYEIVLAAQRAAIEAVTPGIPAKEVDTIARDVIKEAGYGENFSHGLGHGVGLQIHEGPGVSQTSEDDLAPGMTITIEPGIYIKGWGGVRIEDVVLVTQDGCEVITKAPKLG